MLDGQDVTDWPMYRRAQQGMGYLAQEASVFGKLTVEQNILAILEMLHVGRVERRRMTDELLDQFGLTRLRKSFAGTLSGGSDGVLKSRVVWPVSRPSSCSTSRSRGSTR